MSAKRNPSRGRESGYAMLLVFLMAAMIAIALYRELPRFAFEQQRGKEKLLIERGEQYKRAIQVFVRKMNRYPATIEELESTNNIRFLRKRYLDPMTGKDKWRLIHVNGGVLTDSIIKQKAPGAKDQPAANQNTFIAEGPGLAGSTDPTEQVNNPAMRRRASDNRVQQAPDAPDQPPPVEDTENNPNPGETDPNNTIPPPTPTPGTGVMPVQTMPGTPMNRFPFPNQGGVPGQPSFPGQPGMLPGQQGGMVNQQNQFNQQQNQFNQPGTPQSFSGGVYSPPSPGASNTGNMQQSNGFGNQSTGQGFGAGGMQQPGFGQQAGGFGQPATGFGQPASQAGFGDGSTAGQTGAQNNLGNMLGLNGPRPGGMPGMGGLPGMGGTQVGGGIAGVASENKDAAIIVYNERKKYNEWEFVYDKSKDRGLAGVSGNGGVPGTPAGQMGSMPQSGFGNNPNGNNSAFGNSGFGNNSAFGNNNNSGFGNNNNSGFGQTAPIGQPSPPPPPPQN